MEFVLVPVLIQLFESPAVLLGISVTENDLAWSHGIPEYTFNVTYLTYLQFESDLVAQNNPTHSWGTSLVSKLKCRPDNQTQTPKLHCHFNCTKFVKLTSDTYKAAIGGILPDVNYTSLDLGGASFVINPDGIEDYNFTEKQKMDKSFQRLYKLITSNLYLSSNFTINNAKFQNTTGGECLVAYGHYIVTEDMVKSIAAKKEYMNDKWPDVNLVEKTHLEKWVNLNVCKHSNYFVANEQIHSFIPDDAYVTLESSRGELFVTPGNFTSENMNTYNVSSLYKVADIGILHENVRLQLAMGDNSC